MGFALEIVGKGLGAEPLHLGLGFVKRPSLTLKGGLEGPRLCQLALGRLQRRHTVRLGLLRRFQLPQDRGLVVVEGFNQRQAE